MPFNLRNRSLLKEPDVTPHEWRFLLGLAAELKRAAYAGTQLPRLVGKNLALAYQETCPATRYAAEVAAHDQGAHVSCLGPMGLQLGHRASVENTARFLGRLYDGIVCCGAEQDDVEALARYSGVPVWNGGSSDWHPTQSLADLLTMREHSPKPDDEIAFAFIGDAGSSTGNSLLVAGALMGMDVRMVAPKARWNHDDVIKEARRVAERTGARIMHTEDVAEGARGVDYVCTDAWLSPADRPDTWNERIAVLRDYQITMDVLRATGNAGVQFMHSLPAFHGRHTRVAQEIFERTGLDALEVTDEVFESPCSIVFDQAENGMHAIKAVMVATLGV